LHAQSPANVRCLLSIFRVPRGALYCANVRATRMIDHANPVAPELDGKVGNEAQWCIIRAINLRDETSSLKKDYSPVHSASMKANVLLSGFHTRLTRYLLSARANSPVQSSASRSRAFTVTCMKMSIVRVARSSR